MTYEDKPTPGIDYLLYLVFSAALSFCVLFYTLEREKMSERTYQYALAGIILFEFLFLAWSIFGVFRTVYRLDEEKLVLRRGRSVKTVNLDDIEAILLVGANWATLGLGFRSRDYCNRLTDGVKLTTTSGKFYISPTNPHLFSNHIRNMRFAGPPPPEWPPEDEESNQSGEST